MRIGLGFDLHRFVRGRKLLLGGVHIPYPKGLLGHSDGDVVLHAISDALLGATGLPDLGEHFPDTDKKTEGISSVLILKSITKKFSLLKIENLDITIVAEEPKLSGFKDKIKENLAKLLKIGEDRISVKAKTMEGLGAIGKKSAIACYAIISISQFKYRCS